MPRRFSTIIPAPPVKRRYEHKWKVHSKTLTGDFEIKNVGGTAIEIYCFYDVVYKKRITGKSYPETRRERERSPPLSKILKDLSMTDQEIGLIDMLHGGLETIRKLFQRHSYKLVEIEDNEKRQREQERSQRAAERRVREGKFGRRLEF